MGPSFSERQNGFKIILPAGAAGIGPALKVLETFVLPLYDAPLYRTHKRCIPSIQRSEVDYFASLCTVFLRQKRQYFESESFSFTFFLLREVSREMRLQSLHFNLAMFSLILPIRSRDIMTKE